MVRKENVKTGVVSVDYTIKVEELKELANAMFQLDSELTKLKNDKDAPIQKGMPRVKLLISRASLYRVKRGAVKESVLVDVEAIESNLDFVLKFVDAISHGIQPSAVVREGLISIGSDEEGNSVSSDSYLEFEPYSDGA